MLEFRLLGPIEVTVAGRPVALGGTKPRALLAALVLEHGRVVPTNRLVDVVWGEDPPDTARGLIQTYVSTLRRSFAQHGLSDVIVTRPPGYLIPDTVGTTDTGEFARLLAEGREHAASGDHRRSIELFQRAAALWRGPALTGLERSVLRSEARRLDELRTTAAEEHIAAALGMGRLDHLAELVGLVAVHPTNERLRGLLMVTLYRMGRQADALACYREGRQILIEQVGVEPGESLAALQKAILRGDTGVLLGPAHPGGQPVSVVPRQLPPEPVDFTGRRRELDELTAALRRHPAGVRIVAGQGGSGKSALALHVAHAVAPDYPDGQLYAELRGMTDAPASPGEILGRFLRALGVESNRMPASLDEKVVLYRSLLADRRILVLLDDAANEQQVRPLLPGAPDCALLITSRDRLAGLVGSRLAELDVLPDRDAHELFCRIVGRERVASDDEAVARILSACGNLPLAIRIAGARLTTRRHLPLDVLASRLVDERQRLDELAAGDLAVRSSIALSYQALDERTRTALGRMGFLGLPDYSAWTVGWLVRTTESDAERVLERLVDAQLMEFVGVDSIGSLRYRMHDLVRLFARERSQSDESPEELTRVVAHALECWLGLLDRIVVESPPAEIQWQQTARRTVSLAEPLVDRVLRDAHGWFLRDQPALVVAVERAAELGLHHLVCDFASACRSIEFDGANRFEVRARIIEAALESAQRAGDPRGTAVMLAELARLRYDQDLYADSRRHFGEALSRFRDLGDVRGQATVLAGLGTACREPGHLVEAVHFLDQAATLLSALGDVSGIGYVRRLAGSVRLEQGDFAGALSDLDESLQAYRKTGSRRGIAYTLRTLSLYHRALGEHEDALRLATESEVIFAELGDELMRSYALRAVAKTKLCLGLRDEALPVLEWVLAVASEAGDRWGQAAALRVLGQLHLAEGRLASAQNCFETASDMWETIGTTLWWARTRHDLSLLHRARGDVDAARVARTAALKVFRERGAREYAELTAL